MMIYFLIYLFLEVLISVNISSAIGGLMTFFEIILSALFGIFLLMNFKETFFSSLISVVTKQISIEEFQRLNIFTLLGAVLLIIPGFLTDIVGFLMQFSAITNLVINHYITHSNSNYQTQNMGGYKDDEIIDVEIITKHDSIK
jgi:2-isopropylmalate synthase/UPF0716 protein FxsA